MMRDRRDEKKVSHNYIHDHNHNHAHARRSTTRRRTYMYRSVGTQLAARITAGDRARPRISS